MKKVVIFSDGGSRNNPGPGAGGAVVFFDDDKKCFASANFYGRCTNNQAEYTAITDAIGIVERYYANQELTDVELLIFLDSELAVKQINGQYQVKNEELRKIYDDIQKRLSTFGKTTVSHVPRANNKLADSLVNVALDRWAK